MLHCLRSVQLNRWRSCQWCPLLRDRSYCRGRRSWCEVEAAAKCQACLPNPAAQQPEPESANCSLYWTYQAIFSRLNMWVRAGAELQSAAHLQRAVSVCVGSEAASGRGRTGCKAPSCPCWGAEFSGGSPPQPDRYCFQTPHWNTGGKRNTVESGFGSYFYF